MIERYSLPQMKAVWSEDHMFELWLRIEVAASEAWTELGVVSPEDMALIRRAKFSRAAYDRWFDDTKHDIVPSPAPLANRSAKNAGGCTTASLPMT